MTSWHVLITGTPPEAGQIDPITIIEVREVNGDIEHALADALAFVRHYAQNQKSAGPAIKYVGIFPRWGAP